MKKKWMARNAVHYTLQCPATEALFKEAFISTGVAAFENRARSHARQPSVGKAYRPQVRGELPLVVWVGGATSQEDNTQVSTWKSKGVYPPPQIIVATPTLKKKKKSCFRFTRSTFTRYADSNCLANFLCNSCSLNRCCKGHSHPRFTQLSCVNQPFYFTSLDCGRYITAILQ